MSTYLLTPYLCVSKQGLLVTPSQKQLVAFLLVVCSTLSVLAAQLLAQLCEVVSQPANVSEPQNKGTDHSSKDITCTHNNTSLNHRC